MQGVQCGQTRMLQGSATRKIHTASPRARETDSTPGNASSRWKDGRTLDDVEEPFFEDDFLLLVSLSLLLFDLLLDEALLLDDFFLGFSSSSMMSSSASKSELPTTGFGLLSSGTSPPGFDVWAQGAGRFKPHAQHARTCACAQETTPCGSGGMAPAPARPRPAQVGLQPPAPPRSHLSCCWRVKRARKGTCEGGAARTPAPAKERGRAR